MITLESRCVPAHEGEVLILTNITLFFDLDGTIMVNPFLRVVFPRVTQFISYATGLEPDRILQEITQEHDQRMANGLDE